MISIAHLNDAERMFFVTLLLADILAWVRAQPGTGSLRAILYIDELFGYMPPVASPPSKMLLLTLLKQARAFGLGVVLSTQNPVDLDYRGLSNTGTWFIGRLQTERDKMRVMEGLEGAAAGKAFDRTALEQTIAGLGKRIFLLHSVHEPAPITFETRWTLSYLAGPMTREQIRAVSAASRNAASTSDDSAAPGPSSPTTTALGTASRNPVSAGAADAGAARIAAAPVLPPGITQFWLPLTRRFDTARALEYQPAVLGLSDVSFSNAKLGVTQQRRVTLLASVDDGPIALDWDQAERLDIDPATLERSARDGAGFGEVPAAASNASSYGTWSKALQKWVVTNEQVSLYRSPTFKVTSQENENERDFRIRLQQLARESRDEKIDTLRHKYDSKFTTLQERIRRAEQAAQREQQQATQAKMNTAISVGGAILGAIFGRGKIGAGSLGKLGTAARGVGRATQQAGDVDRANETVQALREQESAMQATLQGEIDALGASYDAQSEALESVAIPARSTDVRVQFVALVWVPYVRDDNGLQTAAWR